MPMSPLTGPDSHGGPHAHVTTDWSRLARRAACPRTSGGKPQSPSPTCCQEKTPKAQALPAARRKRTTTVPAQDPHAPTIHTQTGSTCTQDPHGGRAERESWQLHGQEGKTTRYTTARQCTGSAGTIHHSKAVHLFRRDDTPQQGSAPVPQGQMRMWGPQQHLEGAPMLETAKGQPHRQGHSQAMHHRRAPLSPEGLVMFFKGTATLGHSQAMHHQRNHWRPGWRSPGCHSPRRLLLRGHRRAGERGRAVLQQQPLYPARPCYSHATAAAKPGPAMLQPCYNGR